MSRRDPPLIAVLTIIAVGAYVLGALSYYAFTRCWKRAPNRRSPTQEAYSDRLRNTSSYGLDGTFTPIRPTFPSHFSITKLYDLNAERQASIGSLSLEARGDKAALHSDIEPKPHSQAERDTSKPLSSPSCIPTHASFALNVESAVPSSQSPVNTTLVRPTIPRRPTLEDLKSVPFVNASLSEQPINHARSSSVPLSSAEGRPPSSVAWHLPSRSRSITKLREDFKNEPSESDCSVYGVSTPPPSAIADEGRNQPFVLNAKISEASRASHAPSSTVYIDPLLAVRDSIRSSPSPTPESIMRLYGSFPAPPESNPKQRAAETRPRTASNPSVVGVSEPTTGHLTKVPTPLIHPVRPLTIRSRRGGSVSIPSPQHYGLPSRPHTAGASSASRARPSSPSSQVTLTSPKRAYKSTSAGGSLVSPAEDSFLVPTRAPPTPRSTTSPSLSSLRPKTPPRPTSSRNAVYLGPESIRPPAKDAVVHRRQI